MPWTEAQWEQQWSVAMRECMDEETEKSGLTPDQWRVSGRATKANPNKEDSAFWKITGLEFAKSYATWRTENPQYKLWVAHDGTPGNELDILTAFGEVPVRAIIDRVFEVTPGGPLMVVDLKSGARMPEDVLQLAVYAAAVDLKFGVRPDLGAYFNARKGGLVAVEDLSEFQTPDLIELFQDFASQRDVDVHLPNPGSQCTYCEVRKHCKWGGSLAASLKSRAA